MANKKRKGNKKGGQKRPQQKSGGNAPAQSSKASATPAKAPEKTAPAGKKTPGQKQKLTGSARRAAQRKAAKRKRQMLTVWTPIGIIALIVIVAISLGGGNQGGGKVSSSSDIKVEGDSLSTDDPTGEMVPSFSAPGLDGKTVSWEPGQPTVITIWAAWCPHCQVELPVLDQVKDSYPGVQTLSIVTAQGQNPGPTPEKFVADNDITIPVAVDDGGKKLMNAMGVTGFPTLYYINPDGTIRAKGGGEPSEAELNAGYQELAGLAPATSPSPDTNK
jgi:thiol-disulfide isomerase/thioredoxin